MCTYEDLVDATLPYGLIPLVVPQLRTITLGGAVTGLGHRVDQLPQRAAARVGARDGRLHRRRRGRHGSTRQRARRPLPDLPQLLRLARVRHPAADRAGAGAAPTSRCGTSGSPTTAALQDAIATITETREWAGERVDGIDGTAFEPGEYVLTLARWVDHPAVGRRGIRLHRAGDLLALDPGARHRPADHLRLPLALGHRLVLVLAAPSGPRTRWLRRVWPRRLRRSDVYQQLLGLDNRFGIAGRLDRRAGRPQRERVVQDIEVPVERLGEFLDWFDEHVGMRPVWLCPLRCATARPLAVVPPRARGDLRQRRLLGHRARRPRRAERPDATAPSRPRSPSSTATSSLYSEAFYDRETFDAALRRRQPRGGQAPLRPRRAIQHALRQGSTQEVRHDDPDHRPHLDPSDRAGSPSRRCSRPCSPTRPGPLHGVRRQRLRARGRRVRPRPAERARPGLPGDRARRPRPRPRLRLRRPRRSAASTRATPTRA